MRLKRPCNDCGEYFQPTGKSGILCEECRKIRLKKRNIKLCQIPKVRHYLKITI